MTNKNSREVLIKIKDGAGFTAVAGLRSRRFAVNGRAVDERAQADMALFGGEIKRASLSGCGLFKDAAADHLMRQNFFDGAVKEYQILIPTMGTVRGPFQITNLEFADERNGEVTYAVAMESAGELSFTPLTSD